MLSIENTKYPGKPKFKNIENSVEFFFLVNTPQKTLKKGQNKISLQENIEFFRFQGQKMEC